MSRIEKLVDSYTKFISTPWKDDAAPPQRVIFCVYSEKDELKLRAKIGEFEIATRSAHHNWLLYDLTNTFPQWLMQQKYKESYFKKPNLIKPLLTKYAEYIEKDFELYIQNKENLRNTVIAVIGVGTLFGIVKVKDLVDRLAPLTKGRLLVFFPGSYENNNYRLLDGYDGWNYLAVPITADKVF